MGISSRIINVSSQLLPRIEIRASSSSFEVIPERRCSDGRGHARRRQYHRLAVSPDGGGGVVLAGLVVDRKPVAVGAVDFELGLAVVLQRHWHGVRAPARRQ